MAKTPLTETIKVRLAPDWKTRLQKIAAEEGLELSDIARRAIAEMLARHPRRKPATAAAR